MNNKLSNNIKTMLLLHVLLVVYTANSILSKKASNEPMLSIKWCVFYAGVIFVLGIYAIGWQQIIKRLPLTTAYANKAVTVVWGIVWGTLIFKETVTIGKIIGALLIVAGVVLFALADKEDEKNE